MSPHSAVALGLASALLLAAAAPARAAPARARAHVATAGEQDCDVCHRTAASPAFAEWERSPHGIALVKCVVCHGSTGKDFKAKPAAVGCDACHAAQAASVGKRAPADCWVCHSPHTLSAHPHR